MNALLSFFNKFYRICANISTFTVLNQLLDFCSVLPESLISYNDGIFVAIDVVKKLLTVDPKKRATLEEVISHPWFKVTVFCIFVSLMRDLCCHRYTFSLLKVLNYLQILRKTINFHCVTYRIIDTTNQGKMHHLLLREKNFIWRGWILIIHIVATGILLMQKYQYYYRPPEGGRLYDMKVVSGYAFLRTYYV